MLYFPINTVFVEGPDCAGKTTLINQVHKLTNYRWHLFDRSHLSRKVFSELYKRNTFFANESFNAEINNLNNIYVMLLPEFKEVKRRFEKRGDEIHNLDSLETVYQAFASITESIQDKPNFLLYRPGDNNSVLSENLCVYLSLVEKPLLREVSDHVRNHVSSSPENESYSISLTLVDDGHFQEASSESMNHPAEKEYYHKIYNDLHAKIDDELLGSNEYNRKETHTSRRFVYTDNACISFIQVAIRDNIMDFHTVIRSSDVKDVFQHDIKFLYFLASTCYERFSEKCNTVRMRFNLNSAHIL